MHSEHHHHPGTDIKGGIEVLHHAPPEHPEESIKAGYEVSDMNSKYIVYFLVGLIILMAGTCVTIVMLIRGFNTSRPALDTSPASPLAAKNIQVPEKPHLQLNPIADRIAIKAANQHKANSYGVISEEPGMERVHIPVDRAMALLAEGKTPYRQPAPVVAAPAEAPVDTPVPAPVSQEPADPFAEEVPVQP